MIKQHIMTCFQLLALACFTTYAVGFLSPVHVSRPSSAYPALCAGAKRGHISIANTLRRKSRCGGVSMAVDPKELRLRAAQLGSRLKGTNLYFVGMMGTGKSTIAHGLSNVMGRYVFMDTDAVIERALNASVEELFASEGEEAFRHIESQVLDKMHCYVKKCISTGGGIVTMPQNWGKLQTGIVVWLDMKPEEIVARLMRDPKQIAKRPLLAGGDPLAKLEALMTARRSKYEQADVHVVLERNQDVEDSMLAVIDSVVDFIDSNPPKWQEWKEKARDQGIDWA